MSTRCKRSRQHEPELTTTSKRTIAASTVSHSDRRRQRSVSPFSITRNEEKEELAHLNDRLASYIDYVRKLELDKEHLQKKIKAYSEERLSKNDEVRNTYEAEIASLRRLVDEIAKQKAAADLETEKCKEEAKAAQSKLAKREVDARNFQRRIEALERELSSYKKDHDLYEALKPDYDSLEKRCGLLRRDLDAETVLRTDLENKVAGLREELDFKNRLLEEERQKVAQSTLFVETEIEERKTAEYESKLYDQLQAYRDQTADDLISYKNEMERTFETKLNQLRAAGTDASKQAGKLREELLVVRKNANDLEHELTKKEAEVDLLKRRVEELERFLRQERDEYEKRLASQREEVERLQRELELRFAEFADLMNSKVALDQEILMYRKMLEGEESRLNISTSPHETPFSRMKHRPPVSVDYDEEDEGIHSACTSSPLAGLTHATYRVTAHGNGSVEFAADQDERFKCVKLINTSGDEINIGNWVLQQLVSDHEVTYKFHRSTTLKPGATCQVWNSDSGASHDPPTDIVMKNQSFKIGSNITFTLIDNDGVEQANCQIVQERVRAAGSHLRSQSSSTDEKCLLM